MTDKSPILAADDEETDAILLEKAMEQAGSSRPLVIVRDGQEAVHYLLGDGPYHDRQLHPLPALLLLDLKMPRMSGFEVLAWLKQKPEIKCFPVIVFSSSFHESDIQRAQELGADDFWVKPLGFDELIRAMRELTTRWLKPPA